MYFCSYFKDDYSPIRTHISIVLERTIFIYQLIVRIEHALVIRNAMALRRFSIITVRLVSMSCNVYFIGGAPNYHPNSFNGPLENTKCKEKTFNISADVDRFNSGDDDNYTQPGDFWSKVIYSILK